MGKSLLLVEYMEGNILSQDRTNFWGQVLGEVHMSNNTFSTQASCLGDNNAEASGSAFRQAQQTEPAVGQDGSGRPSDGAVIGLSAAVGQASAGPSYQVPVSETRNADEREMGDGIQTQSSAVGGASEWSIL
ncbi:hypothetical protein Tco_0841001 [Tanacetum coccineum]|uniref:Uncharacterized protein n=1 Tax=Tanacetum coccineum TaxID=301880 RepID=A0ABQ5AZJ9_9ASTR